MRQDYELTDREITEAFKSANYGDADLRTAEGT